MSFCLKKYSHSIFRKFWEIKNICERKENRVIREIVLTKEIKKNKHKTI